MVDAPANPDPSKPSSDYEAQLPFWQMVDAILGGPETMRATEVGGSAGGVSGAYKNLTAQAFAAVSSGRSGPQSPYLPMYAQETYYDYEVRRRNAPLTNVYGDISENLSSRPFSKECSLDDGTSKDLLDLSENVDGLGNNLHVFANSAFKCALDKGAVWILVDYAKVPKGATLADERGMGAKPYWVLVPVERMLAVYSKFLNGVEVITQARIDETCVEVEGYEEKTYRRVREFRREEILDADGKLIAFGGASWVLHEERVTRTEVGGNVREEKTWVVVDGGVLSVGSIPLVKLVLGKRVGTKFRVEAPLRDLAYMQVEEFQQESNLKTTAEMTAFPMLAGEGVPGTDASGQAIVVPVGPKAVLFAPPGGDGSHGSWKYVEPSGASLTFLVTKLEKHRTEMRDLGKQPLTQTNLTVVTTANLSVKAHSVLQAWALKTKDALEEAWRTTAKWLGRDESPVVSVHTDFGIEMGAETDKDWLLKAQGQAILSPQTVREEAKRRGVLSDDFDEDEEEQRLAEHQLGQELQPEQHIDPVTGAPVVVTPKPGTLNPPPQPTPPVRANRGAA